MVAFAALTPLAAQAQETSITYYETLSPYGDWVAVEHYGRVWRPHRTVVGVDFVPYASGGRWVHSNYGWAFEPSWSWGWLPFHYGRWYLDPFNGWVWVPDDVWAPAWVEWRIGGGYVGWAPSPPRHHHHVRSNWYFVQNQHFVEPQIWQHRARAVNADTMFHATQPIPPPSGRPYSYGPSVENVRAAAPLPIPERRFEAPPPRPMPPSGIERGTDRPVPAPLSPPAAPIQPGFQRAPMPEAMPPPPLREQRQPMPAPVGPPPMMRDQRQPQPMPTQPMQRAPMPPQQPMREQRAPMPQPMQQQQLPQQPMREQRAPMQQPTPQPMQQPMREQRAPMPQPMQQPLPPQQPMQQVPMQPAPGRRPSQPAPVFQPGPAMPGQALPPPPPGRAP